MMVNWIVSSCVLILAVVGIRYLFRGRVSARVQYALWGLVLLRLLNPVSIGSSSASAANLPQVIGKQPAVQNVAEAVQTPIQVQSYEEAYSQVAQQYEARGQELSAMQGIQLEAFEEEVRDQMNGETPAQILKRIAWWVWLLGMTVVAGAFLATNLRFSMLLRKNSRELEAESELPVYAVRGLDTPCLFGLLRPAVYVTETAAQDPTVLRHAIAHEMTHSRHGDHVWSVLRSICLAVHWYNPLAWWAAILSQRDGELACDEATVLRLGESERAAYGRTLIEMTCGKKTNMLLTATTMTAGGIKERICRIACRPKTALLTVVTVLLITALIAGCTFTGPKVSKSDPAETTPEDTAETESTSGTVDPDANDTTGELPENAVMVCNVADLEGKEIRYRPEWYIRSQLTDPQYLAGVGEWIKRTLYLTEDSLLKGAEGCYISVVEQPVFRIHDPSGPTSFLCYLFTEDMEPAGEILFYEWGNDLVHNSPVLYGSGMVKWDLGLMAEDPQKEYILLTNGYCEMLLDENNEVYSSDGKTFDVVGDYFHSLDWQTIAVSYDQITYSGLLEWLPLITSEMIHEAAQQDVERLIRYLPYIDWGDYERKYSNMESVAIFDLMDIVKEWVIQDPTYDRMKAAMTQIQRTDAAYSEYYAIMLTDLFEVDNALFADICLNGLSDEQEQEVIGHISYNWWISEEEARAILEEALAK